MEREIGIYTNQIKGPLLVVIGGIHGNEHAGIKAIDLVCKMLQVEHIKNQNFQYIGKFLGIIGNLKAAEKRQRFIDKDLNRNWHPEIVEKVKNTPAQYLDAEDQEMKAILELIDQAILDDQIDRLVVLDLHTTSSDGGIFTIPGKDPESLQIAMQLHATVIKGILEGIRGTTLHYFTKEHFTIPTTSVTFESGQHDDPKSVNRAVSAIINCMRTIGSVNAQDVENIHDLTLMSSASQLPKNTKLIHRHAIAPNSQFEMLPGFKNFQSVKAGQILAKDINGDIAATEDGLLLMPLYQKQGEDGFFLIQEIPYEQ